MSTSAAPQIVLDRRCETCPVRHHAICSALHPSDCHVLSNIMVHKHYKRGQPIWDEQDESHIFAIVTSGAVKLSKMLADGRQQIVGLLFPSDCLGRAFSETQQTFAEAATNVELCCFNRVRFEQLLEDHPELQHALFEQTLRDLDGARDWLVALGRKTAGEKVASFLVQMMQKSELTRCTNDRPSPNHPTFVLPLTRSEIADYLGLTIETVSRNFTRLRSDGIVRLTDWHTVEILDPEALEVLAGLREGRSEA